MNLQFIVENLCFMMLTNYVEFTGCQQDPGLNTLASEFWEWKENEFFPSFTNPSSTKLESFSFARFQQRVNKTKLFLRRTDLIDAENLSSEDQLTLKLLRYQLQTYENGYKWAEYGALNPINMLENLHTLSHIWASKDVYNTFNEYMLYIEKLNKVPTQIEEMRTLMTRAVTLKRTNHAVSMNGVVESIYELGNEDPKDSVYYNQFRRMDRSIAISGNDKQTLKNRGITAIGRIQRELIRLADWMREVYIPNTRKHEGVWSLKDGASYYSDVLKWHLSEDIHPETVHQRGKAEVMRIKKKMENVMSFLGFQGNLTSFFKHLQSDIRFYNHTQEQYLNMYKDAIQNRIKPNLHMFFPNLNIIPDLIIRKSHTDGLAATYWFPIMEVNTKNPQSRENFTVLAIALHEGLPGHHLQVSYMRNQNLPDFRRILNGVRKYSVPFNFPYYTAYIEGWGLYAEYMGEEMGLYSDPYELFGRYCFEMFRACRLVVDTGIHYKGWTRQQAIDYIQKYTFIHRAMLEMEVDRYITWPGQACAYKIGELKFKKLKEKAERELDYRFNIIDFHETVLKHGALPLNILEDIVNDWIQMRLNPAAIGSSQQVLYDFICLFLCVWFSVLSKLS